MPWVKDGEWWTDEEGQQGGVVPADARYVVSQAAWALVARDGTIMGGRFPGTSLDYVYRLAFAALKENRLRMTGESFTLVVVRDGHFVAEWEVAAERDRLREVRMIAGEGAAELLKVFTHEFQWEAEALDAEAAESDIVIEGGSMQAHNGFEVAMEAIRVVASRVSEGKQPAGHFRIKVERRGILYGEWVASVGQGALPRLLNPFFRTGTSVYFAHRESIDGKPEDS